MSERSKITVYKTYTVTVFEYKEFYYVIEECQQGVNRISEQLPSDMCELYRKIPVKNCTPSEIGEAVIGALNSFDTKYTPFPQFDTSARNKWIKKTFAARGIVEWERNQRVVDVIQFIDDQKYCIRPYDNHKLHPWIGPQEMPEIIIPTSTDKDNLGEKILDAFKLATSNPLRL